IWDSKIHIRIQNKQIQVIKIHAAHLQYFPQKKNMNLSSRLKSLRLASRGFPRKKDDIMHSVQKFLIENPRPNPFNNNRPGECWFKAFLKRQPSIRQRTSEPVSAASACMAEKGIRNWFTDIKKYLNSKNISIEDRSRVYNCDETGFQVCPNTDGHKSHVSCELSLRCNDLNTEVIALYPNATRILQPCDVAVFRPINMGWKKAVREFNEKNPGELVNKLTFAPLLENFEENIVKLEPLYPEILK
ncbi:unnamed protein product, partial [Acanthoscelides obtectus]